MKSKHQTPHQKVLSRFGLAALAAVTGLTIVSSFADESPRDRHEHHSDGFALGVCVGQTLAAQGVTLPPPAQGERYLSSSDQQAIETASQTCREEFHSPSPSSTPSSEPSTEPSSEPTAAPTTTAS